MPREGRPAKRDCPVETTLNRLIARSGPPKQRLDMNQGAVDHGKAAVLSGEGEEQIRAAKHDSFGAARLAQRLPDRKEDTALSFGDMTGCRHADVGLVDLIEGGAFGGHDPRRRNAAIEA